MYTSYSHICMQHHVLEADGRGFYGVCVCVCLAFQTVIAQIYSSEYST